jgi:hypothetical protein
MRVFRVIFLASLIVVMAGSAFAKNDKDKDKGWSGKGGKGGEKYQAPEFNFGNSFKYELLVMVGGSLVLLERRRRRHRRALVK